MDWDLLLLRIKFYFSFFKFMKVKVKVAQSCPLFVTPWAPGQNTGVGGPSFLQDLPNPGIKPRSPTLQVDFSPAELQGKPKSTRAGSLSLLQGIFPTQESNWGLLHCSQILYQLSYQGSPATGAGCYKGLLEL